MPKRPYQLGKRLVIVPFAIVGLAILASGADQVQLVGVAIATFAVLTAIFFIPFGDA